VNVVGTDRILAIPDEERDASETVKERSRPQFGLVPVDTGRTAWEGRVVEENIVDAPAMSSPQSHHCSSPVTS